MTDEFLAWVSVHRKPRTLSWYRDHLRTPFAKVPPSELRSYHLTDFLELQDWSASYKSGCITAWKRYGSWLVERGYLTENPFTSVRRPGIEARNNVPTTEDVEVMLRKASGAVYDILFALIHTGARPTELRLARRSWYESGRLVVPRSVAKKKKPRVILCSESVQRLIEGRQSDPIFLNVRGKPWTANGLFQAVRRLGPFAPYDFRHYFATTMLERGVDSLMVAALMGHSTTNMLVKHYAKPREAALRRLLADF